MLNDVQIIGWIVLSIGLIMLLVGANSMESETTCIGMLGGGILFLSSMIILFYGYVVMGGF